MYNPNKKLTKVTNFKKVKNEDIIENWLQWDQISYC
jgi:hypothetical protein